VSDGDMTTGTFFERDISRNLFLRDKLRKLLELFAEHDILAILFKGPVLTALAYGHLGLPDAEVLSICRPDDEELVSEDSAVRPWQELSR
jgi:hypothetical protein